MPPLRHGHIPLLSHRHMPPLRLKHVPLPRPRCAPLHKPLALTDAEVQMPAQEVQMPAQEVQMPAQEVQMLAQAQEVQMPAQAHAHTHATLLQLRVPGLLLLLPPPPPTLPLLATCAASLPARCAPTRWRPLLLRATRALTLARARAREGWVGGLLLVGRGTREERPVCLLLGPGKGRSWVLGWHSRMVRVLGWHSWVVQVLGWHSRMVRVLGRVVRVLAWHGRMVRVLGWHSRVVRVLAWHGRVWVRVLWWPHHVLWWPHRLLGCPPRCVMPAVPRRGTQPGTPVEHPPVGQGGSSTDSSTDIMGAVAQAVALISWGQ